MKSIIIIQLCVLLLTIVSTVVGGKSVDEVLSLVQAVSRDKNGRIKGVFKPSRGGFIAYQLTSLTYKGKLILDSTEMEKEVAMKFITSEHYAANEIKVYEYLNAINNSNVEAYGIPTIYYHDKWYDYVMIGMTVFDYAFYRHARDENFTEMDLLILFREFVRITKFIHSHGVFQRDLDFNNMMFSKQRGFIYDFSFAITVSSACKLAPKLDLARRDWQKFFIVMHKFVRKSAWEWLGFSRENENDIVRMASAEDLARSLEGDSESVEWHQFTGLRKVFAVVSKYAFSNASTPEAQFYDRSYGIIVEEIKNHKMLAIPSWLSKQAKKDAKLAMVTIPPIASIADPFDPDQPAACEGSEKRNR